MKLYKGENLVIMGKSGSGKSVMIKCLMGLEQPDEGEIEIMGNNILEFDNFAWSHLVLLKSSNGVLNRPFQQCLAIFSVLVTFTVSITASSYSTFFPQVLGVGEGLLH